MRVGTQVSAHTGHRDMFGAPNGQPLTKALGEAVNVMDSHIWVPRSPPLFIRPQALH